jgi:hypothetical protein
VVVKDILVLEVVALVVLEFPELLVLMEEVEMVDLVCNYQQHLEIHCQQLVILDQHHLHLQVQIPPVYIGLLVEGGVV